MTYCDCSSASSVSRAASCATAFAAASHCFFVALGQARGLDLLRHFVAVRRRVVLHDLHAAAMAVHVAEAADVHQDVEAELLSGAVSARDFVEAAAMPQAHIDDFFSLRHRT